MLVSSAATHTFSDVRGFEADSDGNMCVWCSKTAPLAIHALTQLYQSRKAAGIIQLGAYAHLAGVALLVYDYGVLSDVDIVIRLARAACVCLATHSIEQC